MLQWQLIASQKSSRCYPIYTNLHHLWSLGCSAWWCCPEGEWHTLFYRPNRMAPGRHVLCKPLQYITQEKVSDELTLQNISEFRKEETSEKDALPKLVSRTATWTPPILHYDGSNTVHKQSSPIAVWGTECRRQLERGGNIETHTKTCSISCLPLSWLLRANNRREMS